MDERLEKALQIAKDAAEVTLKYFGASVEIEHKGDFSPVTIADRETEILIFYEIRRMFPDDSIKGEEGTDFSGTNEWVWTIDPIDGTKSFIAEVPLYATLIGISRNDEPVIGIICIPALGEMVYAKKGGGAWLVRRDKNPVPISFKDTSQVDRTSVILTSGLEWLPKNMIDTLVSYDSVLRTWGDGYGWLMLCTGRADSMVDYGVMPWDIAPLFVLIPEAGGALTVFETADGEDGSVGVIASAPKIHDQLHRDLIGDRYQVL